MPNQITPASTSIKCLNLSGIVDVTDKWLTEILVSCPKLKILILDNTNVAGSFFSTVKLPNLEHVSLTGCSSFDSKYLDNLSEISPNINRLNIQKLGLEEFRQIIRFSNLKRLEVEKVSSSLFNHEDWDDENYLNQLESILSLISFYSFNHFKFEGGYIESHPEQNIDSVFHRFGFSLKQIIDLHLKFPIIANTSSPQEKLDALMNYFKICKIQYPQIMRLGMRSLINDKLSFFGSKEHFLEYVRNINSKFLSSCNPFWEDSDNLESEGGKLESAEDFIWLAQYVGYLANQMLDNSKLFIHFSKHFLQYSNFEKLLGAGMGYGVGEKLLQNETFTNQFIQEIIVQDKVESFLEIRLVWLAHARIEMLKNHVNVLSEAKPAPESSLMSMGIFAPKQKDDQSSQSSVALQLN